MVILVDNREQSPYTFTGYDCRLEAATLGTGDYSLPGFEDRCAIERKSLSDLIGCLTTGRDRFKRELARARSYDFFCVVVEANMADLYTGQYMSKMNPESALQSIMAFRVRYGVAFDWCGNRAGGEKVTYSLLSKYLREIGGRYRLATNGQEPKEMVA